jgi:hypothetical protein
MSEKQKFEYKERLKKLELKKLEKYDKLAGKIGVIIATLLLILALLITIARG